MTFAHVALLSAAATCALPFATPASAELRHVAACARCGSVKAKTPTQGYYNEGARVIRPERGIGIPPSATSLAPETAVPDPNSPGGCLWGLNRYNGVFCP